MSSRHLVLDRDRDLNEDVVVGLGLDGELGLLDLEIDEVDPFGVGDEDVKAGTHNTVELAEALDDGRGVGADGVEGFEDSDKDNDGENEAKGREEDVQGFHGLSEGYMV